MKRKILSLSIVAALFSLVSYAQTTSSRPAFGVRAGINFQNLNGKNEQGVKYENKLNTTWHAGVTADLPVAPDYFLQPGVLYSRKGAEFAGEQKVVISYIEIPVNLLYKPLLADGRLLLGFGPYAAFGVGGEYRPTSNSDNDVKLNFANSVSSSSSFTLRRFDAGANFLAGYELGNSLSFQLNAQLGLVKINPDIEGSNNNATLKNTGFGISVGYKL